MEILISPDPATASALAAKRIARIIRNKPTAVLGLATGSTPLLLYKELIRMHREEGLDFSHIRTFNLDEYLGLAPSHPASYHAFMRTNFFSHINIDPSRTHIPSGLSVGAEVAKECVAYENQIREAGGVDIQILGIGSDGHIGFNEPSSSLASRTRIKTLTQRTRRDNTPFFSSEAEVPHHVVTMGIGTIMESREILLLAFGTNKADAVSQAVEGPITASNPASILQMHPVAKIYLDELSSARLTRAEYYRWVLDQKPAWQKDEP
jgi:glucosamine-6-phosphate deaminase